LLGSFLFRGDDVFKPVRVLSGGEKSRLALAKMLLEPVNTLLLDEPTNHLDMQSKEVVKEALLQFDGTVIVISHDRDFLEDLVDRVITFEDGVVKEFMRPLEDYLTELRQRELAGIKSKRAAAAQIKLAPQPQQESVAAAKARSTSAPQTKNIPAPMDAERKRIEAEERNARHKREKPFRTKIAEIEKKIEALEKEKTAIEDAMYEPDYYSDAARAKTHAERLGAIKSSLDKLVYDWAQKNEEMERVAVG
jgi:ATP-binding cassette subfamily F protein 3